MNILQEFDTITAIATPLGTGGVGVIRISGDKTYEILSAIYNKTPEIGKISHGWVLDGDKKIDEVIVLPFKKPHSYTGEDVVEIHCHGGINVVKNILDLIIKNGARIAEKGEFTKRAFLNKKMDLSQAEAVADLIHAKTKNFAKYSAKNLSGVLAEKIKEIRADIFKVLSRIIAGIDFPEDVAEPEYSYLTENFERIIAEIDRILESAKSSNIMRQGLKIAIVGRPNVGKSSLFNTLLNLERAIVTDIAGTTRDVLRENLDWDVPITLIDTAGIRDTQDVDKVEEIGIEYSKQAVEEADFVIFLYDAHAGYTAEDDAIFKLLDGKEYLIAANKTDLGIKSSSPSPACLAHAGAGVATQHIPAASQPATALSNTSLTNLAHVPEHEICSDTKELIDDALAISTFTKSGLDELKECIKKYSYNFSNEDMEFTTNTRQQNCLENCRESLMNALVSARNYELQDLISIDLKSSLLFLDEITGEVITDEILNNIFEHFCIGK